MKNRQRSDWRSFYAAGLVTHSSEEDCDEMQQLTNKQQRIIAGSKFTANSVHNSKTCLYVKSVMLHHMNYGNSYIIVGAA